MKRVRKYFSYWETKYWLFKNRLNEANSLFTHLTLEEKKALHGLAGQIPANGICVEIGSFIGASSIFLASGAKKGTVYCIDTWQNDAMTEGRKDTFEEFCRNTKRFKDRIVPKRGYSIELAKTFDMKADLIFFDGDHSYDGIKGDWDSWKGYLKEDAWVIFHDIGWAEGVQRVIEDEIKPIAKQSDSLPNLYWARI